jgi:hypothetical protein
MLIICEYLSDLLMVNLSLRIIVVDIGCRWIKYLCLKKILNKDK